MPDNPTSTTQYSRRDLLVFVKAAKHAGQYEDMISHLNKICDIEENKLTYEEIEMLAFAYKNWIDPVRTNRRRLLNNNTFAESASIRKSVIAKLTETIRLIATAILTMIDKLLPNARSNHQKLLEKMGHQDDVDDDEDDEFREFKRLPKLLLLQADYHRYLAELNQSEHHLQQAGNAYKEAYNSSLHLKNYDRIKLEIALNYSVFLCEQNADKKKAYQISWRAFHACMERKNWDTLASLEGSRRVMLSLRENLSKWQGEVDEGNEIDKTVIENIQKDEQE